MWASQNPEILEPFGGSVFLSQNFEDYLILCRKLDQDGLNSPGLRTPHGVNSLEGLVFVTLYASEFLQHINNSAPNHFIDFVPLFMHSNSVFTGHG